MYIKFSVSISELFELQHISSVQHGEFFPRAILEGFKAYMDMT
jgi:hypothetical protein